MEHTTTASPGLAAMLRDGSRVEHQEAESSSFMSELLGGRVDAGGYAQYLARFRRVYAALEGVGADLAQDPIAGVVVDTGINRLSALEEDLAFWTGGEELTVDSPAADAYVSRIEATRNDPKLFLAHHYTRYLGDLSGGQAIGRILARTFDLSGGEGTHFYAFDAVAKPKLYKDAYRARLDALPLTQTEQAEVVDEARRAFALNGAIFDELTELIR